VTFHRVCVSSVRDRRSIPGLIREHVFPRVFPCFNIFLINEKKKAAFPVDKHLLVYGIHKRRGCTSVSGACAHTHVCARARILIEAWEDAKRRDARRITNDSRQLFHPTLSTCASRMRESRMVTRYQFHSLSFTSAMLANSSRESAGDSLTSSSVDDVDFVTLS